MYSMGFLCLVFGYRYLNDGGTNQREILHDDTYVFWVCLLPFWSW